MEAVALIKRKSRQQKSVQDVKSGQTPKGLATVTGDQKVERHYDSGYRQQPVLPFCNQQCASLAIAKSSIPFDVLTIGHAIARRSGIVGKVGKISFRKI